MHMLKEIGTPEKAHGWLEGKFEHRALVMGFGHRVYKSGDSRVPTMTKYAEKMAEVVGDHTWMEISRILAEEMIAKKKIHPNLDFPGRPRVLPHGFRHSDVHADLRRVAHHRLGGARVRAGVRTIA